MHADEGRELPQLVGAEDRLPAEFGIVLAVSEDAPVDHVTIVQVVHAVPRADIHECGGAVRIEVDLLGVARCLTMRIELDPIRGR